MANLKPVNVPGGSGIAMPNATLPSLRIDNLQNSLRQWSDLLFSNLDEKARQAQLARGIKATKEFRPGALTADEGFTEEPDEIPLKKERLGTAQRYIEAFNVGARLTAGQAIVGEFRRAALAASLTKDDEGNTAELAVKDPKAYHEILNELYGHAINKLNELDPSGRLVNDFAPDLIKLSEALKQEASNKYAQWQLELGASNALFGILEKTSSAGKNALSIAMRPYKTEDELYEILKEVASEYEAVKKYIDNVSVYGQISGQQLASIKNSLPDNILEVALNSIIVREKRLARESGDPRQYNRIVDLLRSPRNPFRDNRVTDYMIRAVQEGGSGNTLSRIIQEGKVSARNMSWGRAPTKNGIFIDALEVDYPSILEALENIYAITVDGEKRKEIEHHIQAFKFLQQMDLAYRNGASIAEMNDFRRNLPSVPDEDYTSIADRYIESAKEKRIKPIATGVPADVGQHGNKVPNLATLLPQYREKTPVELYSNIYHRLVGSVPPEELVNLDVDDVLNRRTKRPIREFGVLWLNQQLVLKEMDGSPDENIWQAAKYSIIDSVSAKELHSIYTAAVKNPNGKFADTELTNDEVWNATSEAYLQAIKTQYGDWAVDSFWEVMDRVIDSKEDLASMQLDTQLMELASGDDELMRVARSLRLWRSTLQLPSLYVPDEVTGERPIDKYREELKEYIDEFVDKFRLTAFGNDIIEKEYLKKYFTDTMTGFYIAYRDPSTFEGIIDKFINRASSLSAELVYEPSGIKFGKYSMYADIDDSPDGDEVGVPFAIPSTIHNNAFNGAFQYFFDNIKAFAPSEDHRYIDAISPAAMMSNIQPAYKNGRLELRKANLPDTVIKIGKSTIYIDIRKFSDRDYVSELNSAIKNGDERKYRQLVGRAFYYGPPDTKSYMKWLLKDE